MAKVELRFLAIVYADLGEIARAFEHFEQSIAIAKEIGDQLGEAIALHNGASTYETAGDLTKALANVKAACEIFRNIRSPHAAAAESWLRVRGSDS